MFCYLLNESPNCSVTCHVCMGSGIYHRNDHRKLDKTFQIYYDLCKTYIYSWKFGLWFYTDIRTSNCHYRYGNSNN